MFEILHHVLMYTMMAGFFFLRNIQLIMLTLSTIIISCESKLIKHKIPPTHIFIHMFRSASRLIKNLPVPLGTLVRKRARLKPAVFLHRVLHHYNILSDSKCNKDETGLCSTASPFLAMA